ncbi:unnamed protein product [Rotaria sp. Silwood1]|nr:unnamed protein product [Rotaria sp. Silwood1]CAF4657954.1 unnamed protein product [Rotaria sp. Silwood1]
MATNVLSIDQSHVVYIEIDETKIGRISLPYSTTVAELRIQLSERYSISSSTHFVDSKGYPMSTMDEQTIDISHLLCENDVIKLKTDANISIPEKKKSEVASGRFEPNVASSNIKETSAPSKGPTIPAVGGNTLLARNPTAWEETLSNPIFWRVIEQNEYKSVITLLSKQQQEAISISNENIFINLT